MREAEVALSEREQQMLDEMEQALYAEDPRFASQMQGTPASTEQRRRRAIGALGALAGVGLVILGINVSVWVGVGGFLLIVASLAFALAPERSGQGAGLGVVAEDGTTRAPRARRPGRTSGSTRVPRGTRPARGAGARGAAPSGTFMQRLERRWEDRRQRGI